MDWLVVLSHWMLFLARPFVTDSLLPWQKAQRSLTLRSIGKVLFSP